MKRTTPILIVVVFFFFANQIAVAAPVDPSMMSRLVLLASKDERRLNELDRAYLDAYTILRDENPCSGIFGGPAAIEALNELVRTLRPAYLEKHIAVRMSGETTMFRNAANGFTFRMFQKAEINMTGSFYRGNTPLDRRVPQVAQYQPNTRQTRVALLLHELGHLVRGEDKKWVLSDDGHDLNRSIKNTEYVVDACRDEIEHATRLTVAQQLEQPLTTVAQMATQP
ncbi:MAG TPA: hypothetical protein VFS77_23110 [Pyrinomonadaceae bacterium]|nr:hypothetical protein [Pyrinomonadaceae bacterium]